jgi:hypothetical protein
VRGKRAQGLVCSEHDATWRRVGRRGWELREGRGTRTLPAAFINAEVTDALTSVTSRPAQMALLAVVRRGGYCESGSMDSGAAQPVPMFFVLRLLGPTSLAGCAALPRQAQKPLGLTAWD